MCSFCIFIGRELCIIKVHTHGWRQRWHDFCQLYYNIKQIDFIFLCFSTVIDHRWLHSVWRIESHGTRLHLVRTFFFFTRHDVICDLLQYRRTQKWNLFVKYGRIVWYGVMHYCIIRHFVVWPGKALQSILYNVTGYCIIWITCLRLSIITELFKPRIISVCKRSQW